MENHPRKRLTRTEGRKFAFSVGLAFLAVAAVVWWRRGPVPGLWVPALPGAALLLAGLFVPAHLTPVHRAWMGLAKLISRVTAPIMMAVIYFGVITPVGLGRRVFGRDPLNHQPDAEHGYWHAAESAGSDLERQF